MNLRSQASLEAILSTGFLLVLMTFIFYNYFFMQDKNFRLVEESLQKSDCLKIKSVVESQYYFYHNSEVTMEITRPFSIDKNTINFEYYYCDAPLNLTKNLNAGKITIKKQEGAFDVYNINT